MIAGASSILIKLPGTVAASALAALRESPVEIASDGDSIWLRCEVLSKDLEGLIHRLPHVGIFRLAPNGKVIPLARRLPVDTVPEELLWEPLRTKLTPQLPSVALSGEIRDSDRLTLRLVRVGMKNGKPNMLVSSMEELHCWAERAAESRLRPLRFASSGDGRVALIGQPLPALPGRFYSVNDALAIPLGFALEPALSVASLRRLLQLAPAEYALFREDGSFERLCQDDFLHLTRSAVRLTWERYQLDGAVSLSDS